MARHNPEIIVEEFPTRINLAKLIVSMDEIRTASLNTQNCSADQKDKYLNLATQLADRIRVASPQELVKQMQVLLAELGKDERLMKYDPTQDNFWKKKNPNFSKNLEEITIKLLQDTFNSLDSKHHVLQAVKVLSVQNEQFSAKEKVYESVLPFSGKAEGIQSGVFGSLLGSMLGDSFVIEADDGVNLKVKGDLSLIDELVQKAKDKGYKTVSVEMHEGDFKEFAAKFPSARIEERLREDPKFLGIKYDSRKMRQRAGKLIKWTTPISYPVIGALPRSIQHRIENYALDKDENTFFDQKNAVVSSNCVNGFGGGAATIATLIVFGPTPLAVIPAYFAVESIARGLIASDHDDYLGSAPVKAVAFPLEKALESKDKKVRAKGKLCSVKISLVDGKEKEDTSSVFDYFTRIARVEVPHEIEDNLVWSPANHHQYGLVFGNFLEEKIPGEKGRKGLATLLDRENQNYVLYQVKEIEGFAKVTALVCSKGERYVVSLVCDSNDKDKAKSISAVLSNKTITQEEKAKDLCARLNAYYTRIAKVIKDTVIEKEYLR